MLLIGEYRLKLKMKHYKVKLKTRIYSVYVPFFEFSGLYSCEVDSNDFMIFGNKISLVELGQSVRSILNDESSMLYIPAKKHTTDYLRDRWSTETAFDIVMCYHHLQFKVKDWKLIRQKLVDFKEVSLTVDKEVIEPDYDKFIFAENKDILVTKYRFDTIFLVGSKPIFQNIIYHAYQIADDGEREFNDYPGIHSHAHLEYYLGKNARRVDKDALFIDFYDRALWDAYYDSR